MFFFWDANINPKVKLTFIIVISIWHVWGEGPLFLQIVERTPSKFQRQLISVDLIIMHHKFAFASKPIIE